MNIEINEKPVSKLEVSFSKQILSVSRLFLNGIVVLLFLVILLQSDKSSRELSQVVRFTSSVNSGVTEFSSKFNQVLDIVEYLPSISSDDLAPFRRDIGKIENEFAQIHHQAIDTMNRLHSIWALVIMGLGVSLLIFTIDVIFIFPGVATLVKRSDLSNG